jgi:glyoxylase-like metal-dependent hydrolase (beta-lactamase superfamily II)
MPDASLPAAHATPLELPLPGGQPGASVILHPLLCAQMRGPIGWFHRAAGPTATLKALGVGVPAEQLIEIPIIAFLVEHPTAGHILIDTGFHGSVASGTGAERSRNLGLTGRVIGRNIQMRPEQTVAAQLAARGIDSAQIGLVVMTHLHFDHASALADFPGATVLISAPEWRAAHSRMAFLRGYSAAQLDPRPSYRTVDFGGPAARPRGSFTRTLDVFGDGSLILAFTPGHSAGHLSVILRLSAREALIAGDAIYTMATLRDGERPWRSEDAQAFEQSLGELQVYDREHPDALIVPGHDMAHWETLEQRYA